MNDERDAEKNDATSTLSFEQAVERTGEASSPSLERGDVPLDQSIEIYERGEALEDALRDACSRPPRRESRRSGWSAAVCRSAPSRLDRE